MSARITASKKTDNHNPAGKLALRRHFLRTYHPEPPRVFDACQATGFLWRTLREEFTLASYWGVDIVPQKGRVRVDSARILSQPGWAFDVVDVDAYGSPWAQWLGILAHAPSPITVFLTIGSVRMMGGGNLPADCREALGLSFAKKCPMSLLGNINERHAIPLMLGLAPARGWRIAESLEAQRGRKARYIGLRMEKLTHPPENASAPPGKKSSRVKN